MDIYAQKEFEERIIQTKRVSKKNKGGNSISFTALVVVGNKQGKVGIGLGKAKNVPASIQKGIKKARENIMSVTVEKGTIPHRVEKKYKASRVILMPAPEGSGVIAGGSVRDVVELAGITNISAKLIGSNNKSSSAYCTLMALTGFKALQAEEEDGTE